MLEYHHLARDHCGGCLFWIPRYDIHLLEEQIYTLTNIFQHRDACLYLSQNLAMCLDVYSTRRVMENVTINSGQNADFVEEMVYTSWVVFVLQNVTNHIVIENV